MSNIERSKFMNCKDFKKENLSTSKEFKYIVYDEEKHQDFFNELEKDKLYTKMFYDVKRLAHAYKELEQLSLFPTLIVEQNDYPVAVINLIVEQKSVLFSSIVRPSMRNNGIKKLIVLDMCEYLYNNGIEKILFVVNKNNVPNLKALNGINAVKIDPENVDEEFEDAVYVENYDKNENDLYVINTDCIMYKENKCKIKK